MLKREFTNPSPRALKGMIWDIRKYSIHDGPGIRTAVFFKGCPLHCPWCCNPEAQDPEAEIVHLKENCIHCGLCLAICPSRAIADNRGTLRILRSRCNTCGLCEIHCPNQALNIVGKIMTVPEVLSEIMGDSAFYARSGGGLTLTGGEPGPAWNLLISSFDNSSLKSGADTRGSRPAVLSPGLISVAS